ncbi:15445_t:CDS:2 [Funneliformis geosporum]|nr:15445_t:CDS:2 [Funneliformis geosporum]
MGNLPIIPPIPPNDLKRTIENAQDSDFDLDELASEMEIVTGNQYTVCTSIMVVYALAKEGLIKSVEMKYSLCVY